MDIKTTKSISVLFSLLLFIALSSCTTTKMTISILAYNSTLAKIDSNLSILGNGYHLTGTSYETKNELIVKEQTYPKTTDNGTIMENETSIYNNYIFSDSLKNKIEFQVKHKNKFDENNIEYIYKIEVVKCVCEDKKIYSDVCGENGIVSKMAKLTPDQQSSFDAPGKTFLALTIISLIIILPILTF